MKDLTTSLADVLQQRAVYQPQKLAYRLLKDGEENEISLTYEELDRRARAIGALLQTATRPGDRVLLLFSTGLDFIAAYFGCLYAGVVAIPLTPPHPARVEKSLAAMLRIIDDAKPTAALLNTPLFTAITAKQSVKEKFSKLRLLLTDREDLDSWADRWEMQGTKGKDLAFLQYTSGSTTTPKGVMVSHANLLHNLSVLEASMELTVDSQIVTWLPPYHDMGLVGGILQGVYTGYTVTLIPHLLFLQRPIRWLKAISKFKATTSGGPNFAYELCLRKIKPAQRDQLDLSSWKIAFNGAEPIYHKTLEQFADFFASCGFRREAFFPCYGLAEATLMVVGGPKWRAPVSKKVLKSALENREIVVVSSSDTDSQVLVSSGQNLANQNLRIVDPETLNLCLPDQLGEIWVNGPSVASGYWNNREATANAFAAYLADSKEGPFLRTGDLGFMNDGELYVTGRLKNLIIVDGKNHYPHDLERTLEQAHPAIRPAGCAAFSIAQAGRERIVVIVEIQHRSEAEPEAIRSAVRKAIAENHELKVFDIKLALPGSIPKTTSGKIKHFLCKKNYISSTLKETL
ncbi:fatty acyl-AMP ligase [Lewinella cohaerens]|uniref:fatty acyl-AMP ligase n=1 Tax=Lewinella cohaerens TaxID=70995 RepID=UPI00036DD014|nr:fatty acyl-AMP ligase [Lewinella cohaerens]